MNTLLQTLRNEGIILHLTDTTWGLAASCLSKEAIDRIFEIKQRPSNKVFILLVSSVKMLSKYVEFQESVIPFVENTLRPTTIIYDRIKNLPDYLIANDGTVAIRIVNKPSLSKMIEKLGHPIVSTSANISGHSSPSHFEDIDSRIINGVDMYQKEDVVEIIPPSKIIKIENDQVIIIRE